MGNEIKIGSDVYADNMLKSANVFMVQSLIGDELQYNTLDATIDPSTFATFKFVPKGSSGLLTADKPVGFLFHVLPYVHINVKDPTVYSYGTPVVVKHDNQIIGKFYMSKVQRIGEHSFKIECISAVGLLENSKHYGGIYESVSFASLVNEIVGGLFNYSIKRELQDLEVTGWLPIASRRDNLHELLFATGASITQDENGEAFFTYITLENTKDIPDSRIYMGGSVSYDDVVTSVSVLEHSYEKHGEDTLLFDGIIEPQEIVTPKGKTGTGRIFLFDEPYYDYQALGAQPIEYGPNYIAMNSGSCKIYAKKYTHTTRQVVRPKAVTLAERVANSKNEVSVDKATLVSSLNSENVADRLYAYYSKGKSTDTDIVVNSERPGDAVKFTNAFKENKTGLIASLDMHLSGIVKANATVITDYEPVGYGNAYSNVMLLTSTGQRFTVTEGTRYVRAVIIGSGTNGADGKYGGDGADGEKSSGGGAGGIGGAGGKGGTPGKVNIITLDVTTGDVLTASLGSNGAESTLTTSRGGTVYSSADGKVFEQGYYDQKTKKTYAIPGKDGGKGGDGGRGGTTSSGGTKGKDIFDTVTGRGYSGGSGTRRVEESYSPGNVEIYYGNGGSGAVYHANGNDATNESGARGVFGSAPEPAATYGCGGNGGNGGSGGGGGGFHRTTLSAYPGEYFDEGLPGGRGGKGSRGSAGGAGCVIIYY